MASLILSITQVRYSSKLTSYVCLSSVSQLGDDDEDCGPMAHFIAREFALEELRSPAYYNCGGMLPTVLTLVLNARWNDN